MKTLLIICSFFLLFLNSCDWFYGYDHEDGYFPSKPVNFKDINSAYDDMNMADPFIQNRHLMCFSSNRDSKGGDFDIVGGNIEILWDMHDGKLSISKVPDEDTVKLNFLIKKANTAENEFGPLVINYYTYQDLERIDHTAMLYSSHVGGNDNIYIVFHNKDSFEPLRIFNTEKNELYPSFYSSNYFFHDNTNSESPDVNELYFCADYKGNFDIYKIPFNPTQDFLDSLIQAKYIEPILEENLSSAFDDKCPFINRNLLVFTSNKPGGYGGFDLYYSIREGNTWSDPVNFGSEINSEFDEYRPITVKVTGFKNDLLLFSSNRPGGMGGFDLYYVGIKSKI